MQRDASRYDRPGTFRGQCFEERRAGDPGNRHAARYRALAPARRTKREGRGCFPGPLAHRSRSVNRGFTRERVITKQEPDLLIAEDATSCRVSAERYRDVEIGEEELRGWQ
jgi:hypothetical protein